MGSFCPCWKSKKEKSSSPVRSEAVDTDAKDNNIPNEEIRASKNIVITSIQKNNIDNNHIHNHGIQLKDFTLHKVLGKGSFGKVVLVEKIDTS